MTDRIARALAHVPADDRGTWLKIGMALKSELGEAGFVMWDEWSQQADNYRAADAKAVWRSFRSGGGVTIASLYHAAKLNGWAGDGDKIDPAVRSARRREAAVRAQAEARETEKAHRRAAERATSIIAACRPDVHPYLAAKGFPDLPGLVWERTPSDRRLVIPMRVGSSIVNLQTITADGRKMYLTGGRASGAEHIFNAHGPLDVLCEGYVTGLSVRAALAALRVRCRVHVTFSAGNLTKIAKGLRPGLVIADNDESGTGERVARATGWSYWMSPVVGEDANDAHRRMGLFQLSQAIGAALRSRVAA